MTPQYFLSIAALGLGLLFIVFQEKLSFAFERELLGKHVAVAYRFAGVALLIVGKLISYGYIGIRY